MSGLGCDTCEIPGCTVTNDEEIAVSIAGGYIPGKRYGVGDVVSAGLELEGVSSED